LYRVSVSDTLCFGFGSRCEDLANVKGILENSLDLLELTESFELGLESFAEKDKHESLKKQKKMVKRNVGKVKMIVGKYVRVEKVHDYVGKALVGHFFRISLAEASI
jgi:hypothetical protein